MRNRKGFTLVEMLIVIVIIGILAATIMPKLMSVQDRARDTGRVADINQLHSALKLYQVDHVGAAFKTPTDVTECKNITEATTEIKATSTNKPNSLVDNIKGQFNGIMSPVPVKDSQGNYYRICRQGNGYILWTILEKQWPANAIFWKNTTFTDPATLTKNGATRELDTQNKEEYAYVVYAD